MSNVSHRMTDQLALTIAAASVGFVSAVFFCIGTVLNSAKQITLQSTPFWDFNSHIAQALSTQRAQYAAGALLLVFSFVLQVAAALASSTKLAGLPLWLQSWPCLSLAVLVPVSILATCLSILLDRATMRTVIRLSQEQLEASQAPSDG